MTTTADSLESLREYGKERGYDVRWLERRDVWGQQLDASEKKGGLLLQDVDGGVAAEVPDESKNLTGRTRGSLPRSGVPRVGNYPVRTKADIWLRNGAELYEEAVARQWSSATDIPWHTLKPLPDDIERAECQLATFLTEVEFVAGDVPGKWISSITPDYYEPRMYLLSQVMDEARHLDVFRKRALANGGGLMRRNGTVLGVVGGTIDSARDFTEMSARLHISGEGSVLTLFRMGELMAQNPAEKMIYRLCAQDESRHVAFGVMHLQYLGSIDTDRREEIQSYLDEAEKALVTGASGQNPASRGLASNAALAVLLGGGEDKIDEGMKILLALRQRQVKEYVQRVRVAGFGERFENGRANPTLEAYIHAN
ncbi:MAG TPA: hypothetical protein VFD32_11145 [Dehalococcoidia bacterium]|nr:hypothetical protein [Dehalococcoidia bacterium]